MIFTGSMVSLAEYITWLHIIVAWWLHGTPHIWNVDHNPSNIVDGHMVEKDRNDTAFYIVYNKEFSEVPRFLDVVHLEEYLQI